MPTITNSASIAPRPTAWSDAITLDQIDPALGIQSLTLSLTGTLSLSDYVLNLDLLPAQFSARTNGAVTLQRPDGSAWLTATPAASISQTLDPGMANGLTLGGSGSATASTSYAPGGLITPDANRLVGASTVTAPVTASARVHATGPGNMFATFSSQVGAEVDLTAQVMNSPSGTDSSSTSTNITGGTGLSSIANLSPSLTLREEVTAPQVFELADAITGTSTPLSVRPFDTALGQLKQVNLALTSHAAGGAQVENLDGAAGSVSVSQTAGIWLHGADGAGLAKAEESAGFDRSLAGFDGTADFAGASSASVIDDFPAAMPPATATITGSSMHDFGTGSPVALSATRTGSTTVDGPGNLLLGTSLASGGAVSVSFTYFPGDVQTRDVATSTQAVAFGGDYAGPVAGLQKQYIWSGGGGAVIWATTPNMFLKGGAADDALRAAGGSNVLDGGAGSNFLTGGSGTDTFFLDARGTATTWSTIVNFHSGDMATVFGFHPGLSSSTLSASDGASGFTGYTIHAETAGAGTGVNASLTFAGIDASTAAQHFVTTTGTLGGNVDYLLIQYI